MGKVFGKFSNFEYTEVIQATLESLCDKYKNVSIGETIHLFTEIYGEQFDDMDTEEFIEVLRSVACCNAAMREALGSPPEDGIKIIEL